MQASTHAEYSVSKSGRQDTHSEMRSTGSTGSTGGQAVRTVANRNRQAWRGPYNLVGAQGRTQLHETRSGRVKRQHVVNSRQETKGWLSQLGAMNPKHPGV